MPISRRRFLAGSVLAAAGGAAGLALRPGSGLRGAVALAKPTGTPAQAADAAFHSRPDLTGVPAVAVNTSDGQAAEGYLFVTPWAANGNTGAAIFDNDGNLVFYHPVSADQATNFQVVQYRGEPAAAWWEGASVGTYGQGVVRLVDSRYETIATIGDPVNAPIDLHDFVITPAATALVAAYVQVPQNLAALGGDADGAVFDWQLREVSITSGATLWSWNALDHVPPAESVAQPSPGVVFDYFHGNSIAVAPDGSLIISARNTSSLYKVDRPTGDVAWRLRGANDGLHPANALTLLPDGESFWYQHDARIYDDGTISVFDDGGEPFVHNARGLVFAIDETAHTATIVRHDDGNIAVDYMGSYRLQANGNWLTGWGNVPRLTEFGPGGDTVLDMTLSNYSYRALRYAWQAVPSAPPDVAAARNDDGTVTVWASWNGATEVAAWQLLAGPDPGSLSPLATFAPTGFETAMSCATAQVAFAAAALDANGQTLGISATVSVDPLANRVLVPMLAGDQ